MEKRSDWNLNKGKCKVQLPKRNKNIPKHRLGMRQLESSFTQRNLAVLVDKSNMSQQGALAEEKTKHPALVALGL